VGANSGIQWTDHTFNPWIGCTKVSPGCDHCYAETWAKRYGTATWGPGQPRKLTSESNWNLPPKWNREAEAEGRRYRVFCASLADVFDNEVAEAWRIRLWNLIAETPHLDWLLLTKRIGNAAKMLLPGDPLPNVWLGISVVNQEEADRDIPKLLATPARIRFLSMEPLLMPVDLTRDVEWFQGYLVNAYGDGMLGDVWEGGIDWVIVGGESGSNARPMHPDWARSIRDQCRIAGVPIFFKQWGEWAPYDRGAVDSKLLATLGALDSPYAKLGKKLAGRLLDGREWNELPTGTFAESAAA
jgi:protein gp37